MRFSMEDAMRSFINTFPDEVIPCLYGWSKDSNYHVRRLASESTRPFLPWSKRLDISVEKFYPILEQLYADPTRYVTRSVANHLNDLSKTHPQVVISLLSAWQKQDKQDKKELAWMTGHALRTLVKNAHPEALALLGYQKNPRLDIIDFTLNAEDTGDILITFSCDLLVKEDAKLLIDYVIYAPKKHERITEKVYKITSCTLKAGERKHITKRHRLQRTATTYQLYSGTYKLCLQINGKRYEAQVFTLKV